MSTTVKWGLITGMVYVFFSLISNMLGLAQKGGFTMVGLAVTGGLLLATFYTIYLGIKEAKEHDLGGYLTTGQGFRIGMGIALIASVISFAFTLIYMNFIDPTMVDQIKEMAAEQWEKQGMTEEQIEAASKYSGMFMNPWVISLMTIVSVLFWGLIKSLVAASILKKEAPPTLHEEAPPAPTV